MDLYRYVPRIDHFGAVGGEAGDTAVETGVTGRQVADGECENTEGARGSVSRTVPVTALDGYPATGERGGEVREDIWGWEGGEQVCMRVWCRLLWVSLLWSVCGEGWCACGV